MIEVRQARYFLAVADTLHFGRAAEQLAMSQPPLSQAILQLERQLGVTLFDRSGRKVTLTETGRVFAAECRKLVAAAQHAQDVATQTEAGLAGTLRIGVVTSALSEPLLGTLAAFRHARPRVDLQITEVDTASGQQALLRHEIDIAVVRPSTPVRGLRTQPWRHDQFVVALPPDHPLAADDPSPIHLARFAGEPWVWLRREASPDYHDQLMATCRRAGFSPDVRHLANSIFTQLAMATSGLGVTLVPNVTVRQIQPPAPYRPLADRADVVELSLVFRDGAQEPLAEQFLRIASAHPQRTPRRPAPPTSVTVDAEADELPARSLLTNDPLLEQDRLAAGEDHPSPVRFAELVLTQEQAEPPSETCIVRKSGPMTDPHEPSRSDADDVERHACPKCDAQPGSPCRSRGGAVASAYHTRRFTKVPRLAKLLRVPTPADRGPGRPWRPGTPPPAPIDPDLASADIRIGYARCSTLGQELDSQLDALSKHGIPRDKIFSEKISTRVRVRPRFEKALKTAREIKAHAPHCRVIFTVCEMKRLGRDAAELTALADHLTIHGLILEMLAGPLPGIYDPTGPGKLLFAFFAAMAETERENIRESTLEGLDTAARKGKHGGRPPVITDDMLHTVLRRRANGESVEQVQPDLIIPTGKRKGQNPSVASIYRALAEHAKREAYPEALKQAHADFAALRSGEVPRTPPRSS